MQYDKWGYYYNKGANLAEYLHKENLEIMKIFNKIDKKGKASTFQCALLLELHEKRIKWITTMIDREKDYNGPSREYENAQELYEFDKKIRSRLAQGLQEYSKKIESKLEKIRANQRFQK